MSASKRVHVNLGDRAYDIEIGVGNLLTAGPFVAELRNATHAVVITDTNVEEPHAKTVANSLAEYGANVDLVTVEAGEPSKSVEMSHQLWHKLLELGTDRKSTIVAVGGGVIGDLAGFAAATFARGIALVQVPTTLLAQVDSSVGGKVGINLPPAKNIVGAFWQPRGVLIDIDVLKTLPEREYKSGLAEVVKYGVIMDEAFFEYLEQHVEALNHRDAEVLEYVVAKCCRLKADVVEEDETEVLGRRAILNYGHTFCHAIESVTGFGEYLHGEAVSIGMLCASRLAARLGHIDNVVTQRQRDLLAALALPTEPPELDVEELVSAMSHDKKVEHGRLHFVLPTRLGHVEVMPDIESNLVRDAIRPQ